VNARKAAAHKHRELVRRGEREESTLLDTMLTLCQTQMLAQIADETGLDGRTMGLLGFNGALLAADIAVRDILGMWWWLPVPFLVAATALCLRSILSQDTHLGPEALTFFTTFGSKSSDEARSQLVAELDVALRANASRAREKTTSLRAALGILIVGLAITITSIAISSRIK
jgi:hypothetical protein